MRCKICENKNKMALTAAKNAAKILKQSISSKGHATFIMATGKSQLEFIKNLTDDSTLDWSKTTMFHLDEYIGLPETHPASFRKYLKERFVAKTPRLKVFHFVDGEKENPEEECARLGELIQHHPVDGAFVGIGENGHLAFNDPPADFNTEQPFIVVTLNEACRRQQLGEGWFGSFDDVPKQAISMSIKQILKSHRLIVSVPDKRKAKAVLFTVEGEVSNMCPASILQTHPDCHLFLDLESASLLKK